MIMKTQNLVFLNCLSRLVVLTFFCMLPISMASVQAATPIPMDLNPPACQTCQAAFANCWNSTTRIISNKAKLISQTACYKNRCLCYTVMCQQDAADACSAVPTN